MSQSIKIKVKNSYFVIAENILFDKYAGKIGPDACFLYLFFKRIGAAEKTISVSYKYITKKMGWKNEKISKLLNKLINVNLVEKRKTKKANIYIISDIMAENIAYYTASGGSTSVRLTPPDAALPTAQPASDENSSDDDVPPWERNQGKNQAKIPEIEEENLPDWLKEPEKSEESPPPESPPNTPHSSKIEPTLFENRTAPCSKIEHKDRYIDIDILTKVSGKPPKFLQKIFEQLADIPYAWRGVVIEYIARLKKTITEKDLEAIRKLNKLHKPAVVHTQFRRLWNRMKYQVNGLDKLNFSYIYATMKNYSTLTKKKKQEAKDERISASNRERTPEEIRRDEEAEQEWQRVLDKEYGTADCPIM